MDSEAISASKIRPFAASRFTLLIANISNAYCKRFEDAPLVARFVATVEMAVVITVTVKADKPAAAGAVKAMAVKVTF